jgi:hypothetical protein
MQVSSRERTLPQAKFAIIVFFRGGRAAPGWRLRPVGGEFLPAGTDGIDAQAGDEGDAGVAAVAVLVGLQVFSLLPRPAEPEVATRADMRQSFLEFLNMWIRQSGVLHIEPP